MWGKPFDQIFLLLFNSSVERDRVQKSYKLGQYKVKSTLPNFAVNNNQSLALTRTSTLVKKT